MTLTDYRLPRGVRILPPNYRYEVLRLLLDDAITCRPTLPSTLSGRARLPGRPLQAALAAWCATGAVKQDAAGHYRLRPEDLTIDAMARLHAFPQMIRMRPAGDQYHPTAELLRRALLATEEGADASAGAIAVAGVAAAHLSGAWIDLMGVHRVDMILYAGARRAWNPDRLRVALEPNLVVDPRLGPVQVAITVVHAPIGDPTPNLKGPVRLASPADVVLTMFDSHFKEQACQFAYGVGKLRR